MSANVQAETGLRALRALSTHLMSGEWSQFVHVYKRTDEKYKLIHVPSECAVCAWLDQIEVGLLMANRAGAPGVTGDDSAAAAESPAPALAAAISHSGSAPQ